MELVFHRPQQRHAGNSAAVPQHDDQWRICSCKQQMGVASLLSMEAADPRHLFLDAHHLSSLLFLVFCRQTTNGLPIVRRTMRRVTWQAPAARHLRVRQPVFSDDKSERSFFHYLLGNSIGFWIFQEWNDSGLATANRLDGGFSILAM